MKVRTRARSLVNFKMTRPDGLCLTNYWSSDLERSGEYYCSVELEDREIHLLLPRKHDSFVERCAQAQYVIATTGPVPEQNFIRGIQFLFEDNSPKPMLLLLTGSSCKDLPSQLAADGSWRLCVWRLRNGQPHRAMHLPCTCSRREALPDLHPTDTMPELDLEMEALAMPAHEVTQLSTSVSTHIVTKSEVGADEKLGNILGLPRMLTRSRGARLLQLLDLTRRQARKNFIREPHIVHWAHAHGLRGIQPTQELICHFTADRRYRMKVFEVFFTIAQGLGRVRANKTKFSLELTVLLVHFTSALQQKTLDRHTLQGTLEDVENGAELIQKLNTAIELTDTGCRFLWMIWPTICDALLRWPQLTPPEQELPILGLLVLVTISCSLEPVQLAQLIVPELSEEFADLRPVYKRTGPRTRTPTLAQQRRIEQLRETQFEAVYANLDHLGSLHASAEGLGPLQQNIDRLERINRARDKMLRALAASSEMPLS